MFIPFELSLYKKMNLDILKSLSAREKASFLDQHLAKILLRNRQWCPYFPEQGVCQLIIHLVYPLLKIRIEKVPLLPKKVKKSLIAIILDPATIGGHFCMNSLGLRVLCAFNPVLSPTLILTRKNQISPSIFITCSSMLDTKKYSLTSLLEMKKINSITDEKFPTKK